MPDGTWKVSDLAGSRVVTEEGQYLGILMDVFGTSANDVFVVQDGGRETLVPALKSVVLNVSLSEKLITVRMPKGLLDIYAPPQKDPD